MRALLASVSVLGLCCVTPAYSVAQTSIGSGWAFVCSDGNPPAANGSCRRGSTAAGSAGAANPRGPDEAARTAEIEAATRKMAAQRKAQANSRKAAAEREQRTRRVEAERQAQFAAERNVDMQALKGVGEETELRDALSESALPSGEVFVRVAQMKGDVRIISRDGTEAGLSQGKGASLAYGSRIVTGKGAKVVILLPDETVFSMGENGDFEFDEFVYDSDTSPRKIAANVTKGLFRWVTGKVARGKPENEGEYGKKLKLKVGCICIRGTDFELLFRGDSSGHVKLFSGEIDFVPVDSAQKELKLRAGQMIILGKGGRVRGPLTMTAKQRTRLLN
jgi:hypothetical protein